MKYTKIYCGSNNRTGDLELKKIHNIMQLLGNCGYTLTQGVGVYKTIAENKEENTAIIEIYGEYNTGIIPELKRQLEQDSILVAESITEVNFND